MNAVAPARMAIDRTACPHARLDRGRAMRERMVIELRVPLVGGTDILSLVAAHAVRRVTGIALLGHAGWL